MGGRRGFAFASLAALVAGLRVSTRAPRPRLDASRSEEPTDGSKTALFESPQWPALLSSLNRLPSFTVANERGQPLEYEAPGGTPLAMFYADVQAAQAELVDARKMYPELDCGVIPIGVGTAFRLASEGKALLIPSALELEAAGAPAGSSPVGQQLPLFGCLEISRDGGPGRGPILPLFMSRSDALAAVRDAADATEGEGGAADDLDVMCLSLDRAVELLLTVEGTGFEFVPPSASLDFIDATIRSEGWGNSHAPSSASAAGDA